MGTWQDITTYNSQEDRNIGYQATRITFSHLFTKSKSYEQEI